MAETQNLLLKAHSNKIKIPSEETKTTENILFSKTKQMGHVHNRTNNKSTKTTKKGQCSKIHRFSFSN